MKIDWLVPAMHCQGCSRAIAEALLLLDDLSEVEVDLESKHVRFTAPDQSAVDQARRALTRAGYPPN